ADEYGARGIRELLVRRVEIRLHRPFVERLVCGVADNTDDLGGRIRAIEVAAATEPDPFADRILVRKEPLRGEVIDDRHAPTSSAIRRGEHAPAEQRNAERD